MNCDICGTSFAIPKFWKKNYTYVAYRYREVIRGNYCPDCTKVMFKTHRALKTESCFPLYETEKEEE